MKNKLNRDFYRYVLPSMVSMLLSGFYSMVDGVFVGNAVGSQALAAINLVYPVQACMNATAFGLGVGGAVLMSKNLGQENYEEADRAMGSTISVLLIAAAALMGIFWLTKDLCIQALGAQLPTMRMTTSPSSFCADSSLCWATVSPHLSATRAKRLKLPCS